ncbi:RES family NAD+ phosphorylase [Rheinheimera sp. MMS21-TC3]|uniref:RES family NAD+ phosphorylase n=1 Tax=Rheinheimera sp. MMS21-TC3 TaxID=3072790 RepID=UPI0028C4B06A|nr:RES domain-containing protein [Rheinheimera sp. MMS21-TC3]WNO61751.1 RES domain-containing protein [Rheinheimera sp. MMS21-TC3]
MAAVKQNIIHLYRLVHNKWAAQAFDGEGARRFGGRWNSKGQLCIYTANSEALAILEVLVHLNNRVALRQYKLFQLTIARADLMQISSNTLPASWRDQPATSETAAIGDNWLSQKASLALAVPSVLAPRESNILLNPSHASFNDCLTTITELDFMPDPRLAL